MVLVDQPLALPGSANKFAEVTKYADVYMQQFANTLNRCMHNYTKIMQKRRGM